jgi:hypothetical protein
MRASDVPKTNLATYGNLLQLMETLNSMSRLLNCVVQHLLFSI